MVSTLEAPAKLETPKATKAKLEAKPAKTKPATKSIAAKTSGKKTHAQTPQKATSARVPALRYSISRDVRPTAGRMLYAHTMAFLELSGMLDLKPVPASTVRVCIGETAVKWHADRMVSTDKGLRLTASGRDYFIQRGADKELVTAFTEVLSEGKTSDKAHVKNAAFIKAI